MNRLPTALGLALSFCVSLAACSRSTLSTLDGMMGLTASPDRVADGLRRESRPLP